MKLAIDSGDSLSFIIGIGFLVFAFGIPLATFNVYAGIIILIIGSLVSLVGLAIQIEKE